MFNKSIAYRLSIFISIAVIAVFIAIIVVSYVFNRFNINENIKNKAIGLSSEVIMSVEKQLVSTREITFNISNLIVFNGQQNHPEELVAFLLKRYPFINAIHINIDPELPTLKHRNFYGYRNNDSILVEARDTMIYKCFEEERIIKEVTSKNEPAWTDVFYCPRKHNMVVSAYSPIFVKNEKNKKAGYVICEVSLTSLNDSINKIEIENNENGFAFLLTKDGRYITHPIKEFVLTKNIYSVPDNVYNKDKTDIYEVLNKGLSGSMIAYPEKLDHEKYWVYYTRLKEIEWTLIFAMPYDELFRPLYTSILQMLLVSVLGIISIYLIIKVITNRLVEPLSEVTAQLKNFSNGSGEPEINSLNEVKLVSESLNSLKSWHEKIIARQSLEEEKNQDLMQDLLQASEIQQSLIKTDFSDFSEIKEIDLYAIYKPAKIVSGDLFDCFIIDNEHLVFTMGDVSGKGVSAAFFMSVAQTVIKGNATFKHARTIVEQTNNELFTTNQHQFFLTLFLGILNFKTGVLDYCNAAHTPTYVLKPNGDVVELALSHGLPLGLYPNKHYNSSKITLAKGDSIVLYTDGITDLQNKNKVLFGSERFIGNLRNLTGSEPLDLVSGIEKSLEKFKGDEAQIDDITLMCIKYKS